MTVKELMKILAGAPGDVEVMLSTGTDILPVGAAERVETTDDGDFFLLTSEDHY